MRRLSSLLPLTLLGLFGCNALLANNEAVPASPTDDAATTGTDDTPTKLGSKKTKTQANDAGVPTVEQGFDVTPIITGRTYVGAKNAGGWRHWRDGIAVGTNKIYWVEGGANAGVYEANHEPCVGATCGTLKVSLTRPSSFAWSGTSMWVGDGNAISRVEFGATTKVPVANANSEVVNLATDGTSAFWIAETGGNINRTSDGVTSTLSGSNGSPIAMALGAGLVYWLGVDISGANGLLQSVKAAGGGARGIKNLSGGPSAIGANAKYVYYALEERGEIRRFPTAGGDEELVVSDAESPASFAFDDTYAYWIEQGSATGTSNGTLRRVAHNDTHVVTMASSLALPVGLAVLADDVFVLVAGTSAAKFTDGKILRVHPR